jgi:hypothetical protein
MGSAAAAGESTERGCATRRFASCVTMPSRIEPMTRSAPIQ